MAEQAYHNLKPLEPLDVSATQEPATREGMVVWSRNSVVIILARLNARNSSKRTSEPRASSSHTLTRERLPSWRIATLLRIRS